MALHWGVRGVAGSGLGGWGFSRLLQRSLPQLWQGRLGVGEGEDGRGWLAQRTA